MCGSVGGAAAITATSVKTAARVTTATVATTGKVTAAAITSSGDVTALTIESAARLARPGTKGCTYGLLWRDSCTDRPTAQQRFFARVRSCNSRSAPDGRESMPPCSRVM